MSWQSLFLKPQKLQLLPLLRNQSCVVVRNGLEAVISHEWSRMLARGVRARTASGDLSGYNGTVALTSQNWKKKTLQHYPREMEEIDVAWLRRHRLPGEIQCRQSGKLQSQSYCIFFQPAIWQLKQFMALPKTQQHSNLIQIVDGMVLIYFNSCYK